MSVYALEIYFLPSKKKRGSTYLELKSKGEQSLRTISGTESVFKSVFEKEILVYVVIFCF